MTGIARRELVRRLIAAGTIGSQGELIDALAARGVHVTQATASRDLAALGVVRARRDGRPRYLLPDDVGGRDELAAPGQLRRLLADLPLQIDAAPPLLVLRTVPGGANAIASAIDLSHLDDVVGTVAGDDTIFIACRSAAGLRRVRRHLESLIGVADAAPAPPVLETT